MTGLNHALVGGLIGRFLPLPLVVPAALASHFVLDTLPHYGIDHHKRDGSSFWKVFFTVDALAALTVAIYAASTAHYAMLLGGFVAVMPDFLWIARIIKDRTFDLSAHGNWFTRWHARIQRYERPWGIWIELPLVTVLLYVVLIRFW